jgi:hypothetical protein
MQNLEHQDPPPLKLVFCMCFCFEFLRWINEKEI